ncbi:MAG: hypothetical protein AAFX05_01785 [Planctomycetota bacterium]
MTRMHDRTTGPFEPADTSEDFDALAELFLGDDAPRDEVPHPKSHIRVPTEHTQTDTPEIEALIVGHLPIRSGLWVTQYASHVAAERDEIVALVRAQPGHASVDVFGLAEGQRTFDPAASLEDALRTAAQHADAWIIRLDDLDEPALAEATGITGVTLLAAGNDAAVVDAYRTIKSLVGANPAAEDDASDMPVLRVALIGAPAEQADAVAAKLAEASSVFLSRPIELGAVIERMEPTGGAPLFDGTTDAEGLGILSLIQTIPTASMPHPTIAMESAIPAAAPELRLTDDGDDIEQANQVEPAIVAEPTPLQTPTRELGLAQQIGLQPLDITSPHDDAVQLARDADGRLHLLRRDSDGEALASLTAASAWAQRHSTLLSRACELELHLDEATPPILHLFTSTPRAVRALTDAPLRLHLLAPVPAGTTWFSAELN